MKKHFLFASVFLVSITLSGQNERYVAAMEKGLAILDTARTSGGFLQASNHFERIANVEKQAWLPGYYVSYSNMMMATMYMQEGKLEQCAAHLDKAQTFLDAVKILAPEESEVYTLQGFIFQGRIWDNPMVNGAKYSQLSFTTLDKAISLNEDNPRPYYLKGQSLLYTPTFYGGGPKTAMPLLQKADEKFESFQALSPLHPNWGAGTNKWMIEQAQKMEQSGN